MVGFSAGLQETCGAIPPSVDEGTCAELFLIFEGAALEHNSGSHTQCRYTRPRTREDYREHFGNGCEDDREMNDLDFFVLAMER